MRRETRPDGIYEFDDDGRCVAVRVPAFLMDGQPAPPIYNGRPGPITTRDSRAVDAYAEYCDRVSNAWRRPAPQADAQPTNDAAAAYDDYVQRTTNAWRRAA